MVTCPRCSFSNPDLAAHCVQCGQLLSVAKPAGGNTATSLPHAATSASGMMGTLGMPSVPATQGTPGMMSLPMVTSPHAATVAPTSTLALTPSAPPPSTLPAGTLIDGKYRIERILGEGGMGVVYLALDVNTESKLVIKAIRAEYTHNPEYKERILDEGRSLARIDHPNVVRLNAVIVSPDAIYLAEQFVDGKGLDKIIEEHVTSGVPLPLEQAFGLFRQVLLGVAAVHQEGVVHRDIKPANVLVRSRDGVAKVTDFGLAKKEDDARQGRGVTKGIIGSLWYMSPEQVTGQKDLDKRVDIYALGIVLFELLVGKVPFDAESQYEVMRMHVQAELPRASLWRPDLPPGIDEFILRACAKDRNQRFSSCEEMTAALDMLLQSGSFAGARPPFPSVGERASQVASPTPFGPPRTDISPGGTLGIPPPPEWRPSAHAASTSGAALPPHTEPLPTHNTGALLFAVLGIVVLVGVIVFVRYPDLLHGTAAPDPSASVAASTPPKHPIQTELHSLMGRWVSNENHHFDAVITGDSLEFRVVNEKEFPNQGYVAGEPRFILHPGRGPNEFWVEDLVRPSPPVHMTYEPGALNSCKEVWLRGGGERLFATYGGFELTVHLAKITPKVDDFILDKDTRQVSGCKGLHTLTAEQTVSTLVRDKAFE